MSSGSIGSSPRVKPDATTSVTSLDRSHARDKFKSAVTVIRIVSKLQKKTKHRKVYLDQAAEAEKRQVMR